MEYVRLGKSGLKVSRIILGCMSYGTGRYEWTLPEKGGIEQIKAAYALGINTFDTANAYSGGESEVILGRALKEINAPRESFVVMTKLFWPTLENGEMTLDQLLAGENPEDYGLVNQWGLSRKNIFDSVKASLKRLDLEYIDVLQCHRFDTNVEIPEVMAALDDVVKTGMVRYIGMSSCWAWQFHAMQNYALANTLTPFISMQNHYSLLYREEEREMNPLCEYLEVGLIPWSPLGRGRLCRPRGGADTKRSQTDAFMAHETRTQGASDAIIDKVEEVAKKKGVPMAQVAIAWILTKGVAAPIIGTTSLKNLEEAVEPVTVKLTPEEITELEAPYVPRPVVGLVNQK